MNESVETIVDELERTYLEASDGDARDALRRALADAMLEMAALSGQVSHGFVRARTPADLARKMGPERREREAARSQG